MSNSSLGSGELVWKSSKSASQCPAMVMVVSLNQLSPATCRSPNTNLQQNLTSTTNAEPSTEAQTELFNVLITIFKYVSCNINQVKLHTNIQYLLSRFLISPSPLTLLNFPIYLKQNTGKSIFPTSLQWTLKRDYTELKTNNVKNPLNEIHQMSKGTLQKKNKK